MLALMVILVAFILCCFSSSKSLFQGSRQIPRHLLDTSSSIKISGFLLDTSRQIAQSMKPNSLKSLSTRQLLDTFLNLSRSFIVDTSSIPLDISRFCSQQKLNTSSIYRDAFSIYTLRFNPILCIIKYLDLSLFSLDPKTFFSLKFFFPLHFRPNPSSISLVSALNLSFSHSSCILLAFRPRFSRFLGFLCFCQILWDGFC